MNQHLGLVSLVVREYDEAIEFFVGKLGFDLVEDRHIPEEDKRWVVVKPAGSSRGAELLLAKASSQQQRERIGTQTGGRVFLFLYTDDCWRDHNDYRSRDCQDFCVIGPYLPQEAVYGDQARVS